MRKKLEKFTERDFEFLVARALISIFGAEECITEPDLLFGRRPDIVLRLPSGRNAIFEIKVVTPNTSVRLDRAIEQLKYFASEYQKLGADSYPLIGLVVSGALSNERIGRLKSLGIDYVLDGPALRAAAPRLPWPETVAGGGARESLHAPPEHAPQHPLVEILDSIPPGKSAWAAYQETVRDILAATWSPPLEDPLDEHSNLTGVNRRDIIFPNYASDCYWEFLRNHYEAHYIVIDAKNYVGNIRKNAILQIANYLNAHGAGLFGVIACRNATDRSAEVTRREQWAIHRKMIIILNDADLKQMLSLYVSNSDSSLVVRQKIEDFRLGF